MLSIAETFGALLPGSLLSQTQVSAALRAMVGEEHPSPLYECNWHHFPQQETHLIFLSDFQRPHPTELPPAEGMDGCTKREPAVSFFWES